MPHTESVFPLGIPIAPTEPTDPNPTHIAEYGRGGLMSVSNAAARDAIPSDRKTVGMLVYVQSESAYYRLSALPSTWDVLVLPASQVVTTVRNSTGVTIPKGSAVRISGATGNRPNVVLAQANTYAGAEAIGLVTQDIPNNSDGTVTEIGIVENLNTSAFSVGDILYLSPTVAGGLTNVEPSKTNWQVQIGVVTWSNPANGRILVNLRVESTKTEYITDMTATGEAVATAVDQAAARAAIGMSTAGGDLAGSYPNPTVGGIRGIPITSSSPTNGQVLKFDSVANQIVWGAGGGGGGGTVTSITAGTGLTGGTITTTGTIAANFGTAAGTICQGNDSRLSDARTPTAHAFTHSTLGSDAISPASIGAATASHTHGNITNGGAIGSTSGLPIRTGSGGVLEAGAFGTTAGTFCAGDDARLSPQTITLTGDVTGSGTGSFAATIANDSVNYAKMQNVSATDRLLGRSSAGAGDVEEIVCTAYARGILDDADAATARTTLGLGTTDTPKFSQVILENDEVIRNTTNGRIDFMPAPTASDRFGLYADVASWAFGVRMGIVRSSDNAINPSNRFVLFDCRLAVATDQPISVHFNDWFSVGSSSVGNDTMQIGVFANPSFDTSGALVLCNISSRGLANRSPTTKHVDPTFYVYSSDGNEPNDFVRMSHNQTDGVIETGAGDLNLVSASGNINNNGNRIPKVFSGTTPPSAGTGDDGDLYFEY